MEPLREQFSEIALEVGRKSIFSIQEISQSMLELARAGVVTEEAMRDALVPALNLAAAGELQAAEAAQALVNVLKQFNLGMEEAGQAADILAQAAVVSTADVQDMIKAFQQVGPVARSFGLSLKDTATALAILADQGIRGQTAGTGLKVVLNRLVSPSKQVQRALAKIGVSISDAEGKIRPFHEILSDLRVALFETSKRTVVLNSRFSVSAKQIAKARDVVANYQRDMQILAHRLASAEKRITKTDAAWESKQAAILSARRAMDKLNAKYQEALRVLAIAEGRLEKTAVATQKLTEEQRNQILGQIFGTRGIKIMNALLGAGAEAWAEYTKELETAASAEEQAQQIRDTLIGQLRILKNQITVLAIKSIMPFVQDVFKPFLKAVNALVGGLTEVAPGIARFGATFLLIAAAIPPALFAMGQFLLMLKVIASPLGVLFLGFTGLLSTVAVFPQRFAEAGRAILENLGIWTRLSRAVDAFRSVTARTKDPLAGLRAALRNFGEEGLRSADFLEDLEAEIRRLVANLGRLPVGDILGALIPVDLSEALRITFPDLSRLEGIVLEPLRRLNEFMEGIIEDPQGFIKQLVAFRERLQGEFQALADAVRRGDFLEVFNRLIRPFEDLPRRLFDTLVAGVKDALEVLPGVLFSVLSRAGDLLFTLLGTVVAGKFALALGVLSALLETFLDTDVSDLSARFRELLTRIFDPGEVELPEFGALVSGAVDALVEEFEKQGTRLRNFLVGLFTSAQVQRLRESLKQLFEPLEGFGPEAAQRLGQSIGRAAGQLFAAATSIADPILAGIVRAMSFAALGATGAAALAMATIADFLLGRDVQREFDRRTRDLRKVLEAGFEGLFEGFEETRPVDVLPETRKALEEARVELRKLLFGAEETLEAEKGRLGAAGREFGRGLLEGVLEGLSIEAVRDRLIRLRTQLQEEFRARIVEPMREMGPELADAMAEGIGRAAGSVAVTALTLVDILAEHLLRGLIVVASTAGILASAIVTAISEALLGRDVNAEMRRRLERIREVMMKGLGAFRDEFSEVEMFPRTRQVIEDALRELGALRGDAERVLREGAAGLAEPGRTLAQKLLDALFNSFTPEKIQRLVTDAVRNFAAGVDDLIEGIRGALEEGRTKAEGLRGWLPEILSLILAGDVDAAVDQALKPLKNFGKRVRRILRDSLTAERVAIATQIGAVLAVAIGSAFTIALDLVLRGINTVLEALLGKAGIAETLGKIMEDSAVGLPPELAKAFGLTLLQLQDVLETQGARLVENLSNSLTEIILAAVLAVQLKSIVTRGLAKLAAGFVAVIPLKVVAAVTIAAFVIENQDFLKTLANKLLQSISDDDFEPVRETWTGVITGLFIEIFDIVMARLINIATTFAINATKVVVGTVVTALTLPFQIGRLREHMRELFDILKQLPVEFRRTEAEILRTPARFIDLGQWFAEIMAPVMGPVTTGLILKQFEEVEQEFLKRAETVAKSQDPEEIALAYSSLLFPQKWEVALQRQAEKEMRKAVRDMDVLPPGFTEEMAKKISAEQLFPEDPTVDITIGLQPEMQVLRLPLVTKQTKDETEAQVKELWSTLEFSVPVVPSPAPVAPRPESKIFLPLVMRQEEFIQGSLERWKAYERAVKGLEIAPPTRPLEDAKRLSEGTQTSLQELRESARRGLSDLRNAVRTTRLPAPDLSLMEEDMRREMDDLRRRLGESVVDEFPVVGTEAARGIEQGFADRAPQTLGELKERLRPSRAFVSDVAEEYRPVGLAVAEAIRQGILSADLASWLAEHLGQVAAEAAERLRPEELPPAPAPSPERPPGGPGGPQPNAFLLVPEGELPVDTESLRGAVMQGVTRGFDATSFGAEWEQANVPLVRATEELSRRVQQVQPQITVELPEPAEPQQTVVLSIEIGTLIGDEAGIELLAERVREVVEREVRYGIVR